MREESLFLWFYFPVELALAIACPHPHFIREAGICRKYGRYTRHPGPQARHPAPCQANDSSAFHCSGARNW